MTQSATQTVRLYKDS